MLLALALAANPIDTIGPASDKFSQCVDAKADQFLAAPEGANVIVSAAVAACLTQRANLRAAIEEHFALKSASKEAAAKSYEILVEAVRDETLVRVVTTRAKNAKNQ